MCTRVGLIGLNAQYPVEAAGNIERENHPQITIPLVMKPKKRPKHAVPDSVPVSITNQRLPYNIGLFLTTRIRLFWLYKTCHIYIRYANN